MRQHTFTRGHNTGRCPGNTTDRGSRGPGNIPGYQTSDSSQKPPANTSDRVQRSPGRADEILRNLRKLDRYAELRGNGLVYHLTGRGKVAAYLGYGFAGDMVKCINREYVNAIHIHRRIQRYVTERPLRYFHPAERGRVQVFAIGRGLRMFYNRGRGRNHADRV